MTDHPTLTDDDLSLALDGEADAELLARIDADPDAQARLEQLRAAATRLRAEAVTPLDDDTVDELIATALDTPVAPPRPAAARGRGATPWIVAAAAILLMVVGLSLVWSGQNSDEDQASAANSATAASQGSSSAGDAEPDSSFSMEEPGAEPLAGGHGAAPTTTATMSGEASTSLPVLYLGTYPSGDELREATATSFADAAKASGSEFAYDTGDPDQTEQSANTRTGKALPSEEAIDRCADQLQVTLAMKAAPIQTGYATVDDQPVLVYEFNAKSARSGKDTTLVAAVGVDACDEVVFFER